MTARAAKRRRQPSEPAKVVQAALVRLGRFCIGCGCCDAVGCAVGCSGGCGWLQTYDGAGVPVGVCTECPAYRPVLMRLTPRQIKAIYYEKVAKAEEWG